VALQLDDVTVKLQLPVPGLVGADRAVSATRSSRSAEPLLDPLGEIIPHTPGSAIT
jgi:hypothetical protein